MYGMYLSLCMIITVNDVHSIYSSFLENIKLFYIYRVVVFLIYVHWNTGSFKLFQIFENNQMFRKSSKNTPVFFFFSFVVVVKFWSKQIFIPTFKNFFHVLENWSIFFFFPYFDKDVWKTLLTYSHFSNHMQDC